MTPDQSLHNWLQQARIEALSKLEAELEKYPREYLEMLADQGWTIEHSYDFEDNKMILKVGLRPPNDKAVH